MVLWNVNSSLVKDIERKRSLIDRIQYISQNYPQSKYNLNYIRDLERNVSKIKAPSSLLGIPSYVEAPPKSLIEEALPYYEDISFEDALKSESHKTRYFSPSVKQIKEEIPIKKSTSFLKGISKERIGKIASIAAQQVAINVLWPGDFWTNMASTGAWEAGQYAAKRLGMSKGKGMLLGGLGIAAINIGANLFSAKDDAYNTIEGLHPGGSGLGAQSLKANSDFGSGWDSARALAKSIYKDVSPKKAFKMLRESSEWKQMLNEASEIKKLSHGVFGTTYLMEGQFKGSPFRFIKKTSENSFGEALMEKGGEVIEVTNKMRDEALEHESIVMRFMEDRIAPSNYGYNKNTNSLYMELMPGKTIHELTKEGVELPVDDILQKMNREIDIATKYGIGNADIHAGNVMYDPVSKKVSWIDWGLGKRFDPKQEGRANEALTAMRSSVERHLTPTMRSQPRKLNPDSNDFGDLFDFPAPKTANKRRPVFDKTVPFAEDKTFQMSLPKTNNQRMRKRTAQQIQQSFAATKNGARRHARFNTVNTRNLG